MQKLLIADNTESFCNALQEALKDTYKIWICHDGEEALSVLPDFQPDLMWLDVNLCKVDGITILEQAAVMGQHPLVLAAGTYFSDYCIAALQKLGVAYVVNKPYSLSAAVVRLNDITQWHLTPGAKVRDLREGAEDILLTLGVRPKLGGYRCLQEALVLMAQRPGQAITKELYPEIAAKLGTNAKCVERVIRGAIRDSWEQRDDRIWSRYFDRDESGSVPCPTNGGFIIRLSRELTRLGKNTSFVDEKSELTQKKIVI